MIRVIPKHEYKRGDAVLYNQKYVITYIYIDKKERKSKRNDLTVYVITKKMHGAIRKWFDKTYPMYEIIRINEIEKDKKNE